MGVITELKHAIQNASELLGLAYYTHPLYDYKNLDTDIKNLYLEQNKYTNYKKKG